MAAWPVSLWLSSPLFVSSISWSFAYPGLPGPELETVLHTLREATNMAADFVRAQGGRREERLLNIPECVRDAAPTVEQRSP